MAFFKKSFVFGVISLAALGLVACSDDGSANGPAGDENLTEESSSSSLVTSSSSAPTEDLGSSSSVKATEQVDGSSSSVTSSGGSAGVEGSSSSSVILSSSSEESSIKDGSEYDAVANTLTDLRDGQVYKTVTIGTQIWMAENLNYAYTGVPYKYGSYTSDSTSWCYSNEASYCDEYGRLYIWSAVMDSAAQFSENIGIECGYERNCTPNRPHRGICPQGWHVPNNVEWNTLWTAVGGNDTAGTKLKSTSGWYGSGNGTDSFGFAVLPAGYRDYYGSFFNEGSRVNFWVSSGGGSYYGAYSWYFSYDFRYVFYYFGSTIYGFSVRCLRD